MDIKVKLINGGIMPQKQRKGDACFDCYANESVFIKNGEIAKIPLGFALQLPSLAMWRIDTSLSRGQL